GMCKLNKREAQPSLRDSTIFFLPIPGTKVLGYCQCVSVGTLIHSARLQMRFDVVARKVVEAASDERSPAGLVRCAEAAARLAVKVFVEEDEFAPVRIAGEACVAALPRRVALV